MNAEVWVDSLALQAADLSVRVVIVQAKLVVALERSWVLGHKAPASLTVLSELVGKLLHVVYLVRVQWVIPTVAHQLSDVGLLILGCVQNCANVSGEVI